MRGRLLGLLCFLVLAFNSTNAQIMQVNRENRTISVTVTGQVKVEPEMARVYVGYSNYGSNQENVFQDNVSAANRVLNAVVKVGVPKENIETENVSLALAYDEDWPEEWKEERRYQARQEWTITVPVEQAQMVVDTAAASGANEIEGVGWMVKDESALKAKAYSAALAKAHSLAAQMARELGAQLGDLLYASNSRPVAALLGGRAFQTMETVTVEAGREPQLRLFPEEVEEEATVYAVFSIE